MAEDLETLASEFATEVEGVLRATLPDACPVKAVRQGHRYVVRPEAAGFEPMVIPLRTPAGDQVGDLRVSILCSLDHRAQYLAVDRSAFILRWVHDRQPLLRLEYERNMHTVPAAHWQIHAERGSFSAMLAQTGSSAPHSITKLHIPVGGARMRPCLEDFIEFLIRDCGVQGAARWEDEVHAGRERWRRRQIATLVRDAPDEVLRVLREHHYTVIEPTDPLPGKPETLRRA